MRLSSKKFQGKAGAPGGFTLVEVVIALALLGVMFEGVVLGYIRFSQMADWSAHSLAAQSLASQGAEQARAAKWDTQAWPQGTGKGQSDELGVTAYMQTNTLDLAANGQPMIATNFISITTVSVSPPVRQIRSDCVWRFMTRPTSCRFWRRLPSVKTRGQPKAANATTTSPTSSSSPPTIP